MLEAEKPRRVSATPRSNLVFFHKPIENYPLLRILKYSSFSFHGHTRRGSLAYTRTLTKIIGESSLTTYVLLLKKVKRVPIRRSNFDQRKKAPSSDVSLIEHDAYSGRDKRVS